MYDFKDDGVDPTNCEDNFGSVTQTGATFSQKPSFMAALAAQTGIGEAATFAGRVAAAFVDAPPAWNLTAADSAFVLAFSGGSLPGAAAYAVWTNVSTCVLAAVPGARAACGAAGVDELGCLALGCCFDEDLNSTAAPGVPRCYAAAQPPQGGGGQKVCPAAERADCGYYGIGEDECTNARGCCWDSSKQPAGPQCFFAVDGRVGGPLNVSFPVGAPGACFGVRDVFGFDRGSVCAGADGVVQLRATDGPAYLL